MHAYAPLSVRSVKTAQNIDLVMFARTVVATLSAVQCVPPISLQKTRLQQGASIGIIPDTRMQSLIRKHSCRIEVTQGVS